MGIKQKEGNGRESAHGISLISRYFQPFRAHLLEIDIFLKSPKCSCEFLKLRAHYISYSLPHEWPKLATML